MARTRGTPNVPIEKQFKSYLENIRAGKSSDYYINVVQRLLQNYKTAYNLSSRELDEAICAGCDVEIKKYQDTIKLGLGPYEVGRYNKLIKLLKERRERSAKKLRDVIGKGKAKN